MFYLRPNCSKLILYFIPHISEYPLGGRRYSEAYEEGKRRLRKCNVGFFGFREGGGAGLFKVFVGMVEICP